MKESRWRDLERWEDNDLGQPGARDAGGDG